MILLIDNYDSFVYNLFHLLSQQGAEAVVYRNDALTVKEALSLQPQGIVLSPGPGHPAQAGICVELVQATVQVRMPLLGVCLGHQAIGLALKARVVLSPVVMHGKVSAIYHHERGLMEGLPSPFQAARYHSLMVEGLPSELVATAHSEDGVLMSLAHQSLPLHGVQFHPESIATEHGHTLVRNFLNFCC